MRKVLFIGSFKMPKHGYYGGMNFACRSLKEQLISQNIEIIELDTTIKDICKPSIFPRLPSLIMRSCKFVWITLLNFKASHLWAFVSSGNSYLDKLPAIFLAFLLRKKVIIFPRSGSLLEYFEKKHYSFFINLSFRLANYVVCQSEFWKEYFKNKGVSREKLVVIENWMDEETITNSHNLLFNSYSPESQEPFKMIFVSRIVKEKGITDLIEVAKKLPEDFDFIIDVYGAGQDLSEFQLAIKDNGLEKKVRYCNWLKREMLLNTINSYHLALFPSRFEGYPNSMLDYIFSKIPVLASNVPTVESVGNNKVTYYKLGDIDDFRKKIVFCQLNYQKIVADAQNLYIEKCAKNNIEYAFRKIEPLLE